MKLLNNTKKVHKNCDKYKRAKRTDNTQTHYDKTILHKKHL